MTPVDVFVAWRGRALDRLSGGYRGDVLNAVPSRGAAADGPRIAAGLRRSINELIATAAGNSVGHHLDYARLASNPAYREYRTASAALGALDLATLLSRGARLPFWINVTRKQGSSTAPDPVPFNRSGCPDTVLGAKRAQQPLDHPHALAYPNASARCATFTAASGLPQGRARASRIPRACAVPPPTLTGSEAHR